MKVKDIIELSMPEVMELSDQELRAAYTNLRRSAAARARGFEQAGLPVNIPERLQYKIPARYLSRPQLENMVAQGKSAVAPIYSVSGYMRYQEQYKNELKSRFGMSDMTDEQFKKYGEFMGAMQKRMKGAWDKVSAEAYKMASEALRLNMNPSQFMRNFAYWSEHLEDLEAARPLERKNLKPSDYVKQLNLPKIGEWKRENRETVERYRPQRGRKGRK